MVLCTATQLSGTCLNLELLDVQTKGPRDPRLHITRAGDFSETLGGRAHSNEDCEVRLVGKMEDDSRSTGNRVYEAQLERTIQELSNMKRQLEDAVNEVRSDMGHSC